MQAVPSMIAALVTSLEQVDLTALCHYWKLAGYIANLPPNRYAKIRMAGD